MAYPTGSGSERLMRGSVEALENQNTALDFTGAAETTKNQITNTVPALHIITLLSLSCQESDGQTNNGIIIKAYNGASTIDIGTFLIPQDGTFVFSDKLVLVGGDQLRVQAITNYDIEIWYSYIDQDWTTE
jgi:hypothetical protein